MLTHLRYIPQSLKPSTIFFSWKSTLKQGIFYISLSQCQHFFVFGADLGVKSFDVDFVAVQVNTPNYVKTHYCIEKFIDPTKGQF
jgi:hypothetical protein